MIRFGLWLGLVASVLQFTARAAELRPFTAKSLADLRQAHAGKPFVVAFWSIHCAPCKDEMTLLTALHRRFPGVPIELVATDSPREEAAINRVLAGHKLGRIGSWIFADEFAERVRFSVDRTWRGELPRTYFFDAAHQPVPQSGSLDPAWAESWFSRAASPSRK